MDSDTCCCWRTAPRRVRSPVDLAVGGLTQCQIDELERSYADR
jgi:hypothetical protein